MEATINDSDFQKLPTKGAKDLDGKLTFLVQFYNEDGDQEEWVAVSAYDVKNYFRNAYRFTEYHLGIYFENLPATIVLGYLIIGCGLEYVEYFDRWEISEIDNEIGIVGGEHIELKKF